MEEVQTEAENPFFPKESTEHQIFVGKDKSLCKGMAELLWDSKHEEADRRHKWVAVPSNPYVYMEAMEETKDKGEESAENGSARGLSISGRKHTKRVLVCNSYGGGQYGNDERKAGTRRLL